MVVVTDEESEEDFFSSFFSSSSSFSCGSSSSSSSSSLITSSSSSSSLITSSSSSSSDIDPPPPPPDYHIFLSFRGDTRKTFTDHLYTALVDKGYRTFRDDDELERGKEIEPELQKAIRQSKCTIIVLSKDFVSSKWCLDELVSILERRRTSYDHLVLPVFYDVDPSQVRNQTGQFAEAFERHCEKYEPSKVERWREALREVANLGGMVLKDQADGHEAKFIKNIVKVIEGKMEIMSNDGYGALTYLVGGALFTAGALIVSWWLWPDGKTDQSESSSERSARKKNTRGRTKRVATTNIVSQLTKEMMKMLMDPPVEQPDCLNGLGQFSSECKYSTVCAPGPETFEYPQWTSIVPFEDRQSLKEGLLDNFGIDLSDPFTYAALHLIGERCTDFLYYMLMNMASDASAWLNPHKETMRDRDSAVRTWICEYISPDPLHSRLPQGQLCIEWTEETGNLLPYIDIDILGTTQQRKENQQPIELRQNKHVYNSELEAEFLAVIQETDEVITTATSCQGIITCGDDPQVERAKETIGCLLNSDLKALVEQQCHDEFVAAFEYLRSVGFFEPEMIPRLERMLQDVETELPRFEEAHHEWDKGLEQEGALHHAQEALKAKFEACRSSKIGISEIDKDVMDVDKQMETLRARLAHLQCRKETLMAKMDAELGKLCPEKEKLQAQCQYVAEFQARSPLLKRTINVGTSVWDALKNALMGQL